MILLEYNIDTVVETIPVRTNAAKVLEWQHEDGRALNPFLFMDQRWIPGMYMLTLWTDMVEDVGEHRIRYRFYYSDQPSNYVLCDVASVMILDPCMPGDYGDAPVMNAPFLTNVIYTVGQPINAFNFMDWTTNKPECDSKITYEID